MRGSVTTLVDLFRTIYIRDGKVAKNVVQHSSEEACGKIRRPTMHEN